MNEAPLFYRLISARTRLGLTKDQAATDAMVARDTYASAEAGKNLRTLTVQRLEAWLVRAERRLERRVPRP